MTTLATRQRLSNELRVTTVGTGTCVPRLDRGGPCTLVRGAGFTVAVDLGLGSLHSLARLGVRHVELDAVFLTHFHPDHTAELDSLLFAANYDESPRTGSLTLAGGPGLRGFLEALEIAHGGWLTPKGYELKVCELASGEETRLGKLVCRTGNVQHIESSVAYRFELNHRAVAISGDTGPSSELEALARGVDLLIVEASLPEGKATTAHLTAGQAGELGRRAGARRLVLNHLYPAADRDQPEGAAAATFDGAVVVARDGMELEV